MKLSGRNMLSAEPEMQTAALKSKVRGISEQFSFPPLSFSPSGGKKLAFSYKK
jgi:hypothetical protein